MKRQLFHAPKQRRAQVGSQLVPIDRTVCPDCRSALSERHLGERPLLRHGGYGAERLTVTVWCAACGWSLTPEVSEVKP